MPVTTTCPPVADTSRHAGLRDALAAELRRPQPFGQPDVWEELLPRADVFSVTVVWDAWAGVDELDRPEIIVEAYRAAQPDRVDRVAYALGYTTDEAVRLGLLSHWITLTARPDRTPSETAAYVAALAEIGGAPSPGQYFPVLRVGSHERAVGCRDELMRRFPESEADWLWGQEMRFRTMAAVG